MAVTAAERAAKWAHVLVDDIAGWSGASGNWPLQSASGMLRRVVDAFAAWSKGEGEERYEVGTGHDAKE